jgi:hypothetical protein
MKITIPTTLIALLLQTSAVFAAESGSAGGDSKPPFLQVGIERVVIDAQGLSQASEVLAASIRQLAVSIEQLSNDKTALADQDRVLLMSAMQSVDAAARALGELAQDLPRAVDDFGEHLPQATENAKSLVNATLDAAVLRLSIYTFVLFGALALSVIAVIWFIYRQYLAPLTRRLDRLAGGPEYLEAMASHMRQTSANLLQIEQQKRRGNRPPATD